MEDVDLDAILAAASPSSGGSEAGDECVNAILEVHADSCEPVALPALAVAVAPEGAQKCSALHPTSARYPKPCHICIS